MWVNESVSFRFWSSQAIATAGPPFQDPSIKHLKQLIVSGAISMNFWPKLVFQIARNLSISLLDWETLLWNTLLNEQSKDKGLEVKAPMCRFARNFGHVVGCMLSCGLHVKATCPLRYYTTHRRPFILLNLRQPPKHRSWHLFLHPLTCTIAIATLKTPSSTISPSPRHYLE